MGKAELFEKLLATMGKAAPEVEKVAPGAMSPQLENYLAKMKGLQREGGYAQRLQSPLEGAAKGLSATDPRMINAESQINEAVAKKGLYDQDVPLLNSIKNSKLKGIAGTAAVGGAAAAGTLGGNEDASAGEYSQFLKEMAKMPDKEKAAKLIQESYKNPNLPYNLRDEYGSFLADKIKELHPEVNKTNLQDPESLQNFADYIKKQTGTPANVHFDTSENIKNSPEVRQRFTDLANNMMKSATPEQKQAIIDKAIKGSSDAYGFSIPKTGEIYIPTDKHTDINSILTTVPHELVHAQDDISGAKLKDTLMNLDLDKFPEPHRSNLKQMQDTYGKGLFRAFGEKSSIPEQGDNLTTVLNRGFDLYPTQEFSLAKHNPQSYVDVKNALAANKDTMKLGDKDKFIRQIDPEYQQGVYPSVGHSASHLEGIERTKALNNIFTGADPLSKESGNPILRTSTGVIDTDAIKKAAAMAPVAGMGAMNSRQPDASNPLDMLKSGFDAYRQQVADPMAAVLKKQMTPDIQAGSKTYNTATPLTDVGTAALSDITNYGEGPVAGAVNALDFLSSFGKDKNNK